jgi:hypothetical protein
MTQTSTAQWGKRLRVERPRDIFFIDSDLRGPLERAAERNGATVAKIIKTAIVTWLRDQQNGEQP